LDQQFAVASRGQLLALGMTDNAVQHRLRAGGPWQVLLPGIYLGMTGAPDLKQKEVAALLYAGPGAAVFRSVLAEVAEGIRSTAEGDLRDLIAAARLPMPLFNPSLYDGDTFIAKPDAWWPEAGVAAEADSREWHLSPDAWERTMRRHDQMASVGIIVLHFSPRQTGGTGAERDRGGWARALGIRA
jgi:hypothetical protein